MARQYGQIQVTIWDDPDFLALSGAAQRIYMMLITQKDLRPTGVIGLSERRWAKYASDTDRQGVEDALRELVEARYLIVDEDSEELLIRTFMRHDGGYRNTNIRKSIESDFGKIHSATLRAFVAEEFKALTGIDTTGPQKPRSKSVTNAVPKALPDTVRDGVPDGDADAIPEGDADGDPKLTTDNKQQTTDFNLHTSDDDTREHNSRASVGAGRSSSDFDDVVRVLARIALARARSNGKTIDTETGWLIGARAKIGAESGDRIRILLAAELSVLDVAAQISGDLSLARAALRKEGLSHITEVASA